MAESGTTISDLDPTAPLDTGLVSDLDNHMRLLKSILKTQFPGVNGNGFNKPIITTETEFSRLNGLVSNLQAQIDNLELGTIPIFGVTTYTGTISNIRPNFKICDGTNGTPNLVDRFIWMTTLDTNIGQTGGSANTQSVSHNHTYTHNHPGSVNSAGNHTHNLPFAGGGGVRVYTAVASAVFIAFNATNLDGVHTHTYTSSATNTPISAGSSGVGRNLPPYAKLVYIMRFS